MPQMFLLLGTRQWLDGRRHDRITALFAKRQSRPTPYPGRVSFDDEESENYQLPDGMWSQLVDDPACWAETSGTAMFTYAMITGVKQGWLDKKEYSPVARKAWMALIPYINEEGDVTEVCIGTNKKNDKQYYYDRRRIVGDYHGQAPILWCCFALIE